MPLVDVPDTELIRKAEQNWRFCRLYDPPIDDKTPQDGQGYPSSSVFVLRDKDEAIVKGFTINPVGWDGDWPELGVEINNTDQATNIEEAGRSIVKGKKDRVREIKR